MNDIKPQIFDELVKLFKPYQKKLNFRTDGKSKYELSGKKKVRAYNKDFDGMFFAAAVTQKGFVGFYFFPIYTHVNEFKNLEPILKKCLKGKSCFHVKKLDKDLFASLNQLLKKGFEVYKKSGWV